MQLTKKEIWAWIFLALAVVCLNAIRHGGPIVADDSFQYMSIAKNLAQGNGIRTSIVHFDPERSHGVLPAPATWFPAGYPVLMALLTLAGVSPPWAGFLVSSASLCLLIPITFWFCAWYGLSVSVSRVVVLCLIVNGTAITLSTAVMTDSLFTALSIGSLGMLLVACSRQRKTGSNRSLGLWALCGLAIGVSCWVRYAGLFLFASVTLYLVLEGVRGRWRDLRGPLLAIASAALPVAALLARNLYLTGDWRGGNSKASLSSALKIAKALVAALYHLFFGALHLDRLGAAEFLLAVASAACVVLVTKSLLQRRESVTRALRDRQCLLPALIYITVYMGTLLALSFWSPVGLTERLCYPLLPLAFVLAGLIVTLAFPQGGRTRKDRIGVASVVIVVAGYVLFNVRDSVRPSFSSSAFLNRRIEAFLEAPTDRGEALKTWVQSNIPADANVVATFGQATGHVLQRNTVSLVSSEYSNQKWDERQLRDLMARFRADFLILYPETGSHAAPVTQKESPFLTALVRAKVSPGWLHLAAENPYMKIFRR